MSYTHRRPIHLLTSLITMIIVSIRSLTVSDSLCPICIRKRSRTRNTQARPFRRASTPMISIRGRTLRK